MQIVNKVEKIEVHGGKTLNPHYKTHIKIRRLLSCT